MICGARHGRISQPEWLGSERAKTRGRAFLLGILALLLIGLFSPRTVHAQALITRDAPHEYFVEVEPHAVLTPFWPPRGTASVGGGGGALFAFNVARRGFLPQVNDSFAVGVGVDFVHYLGGPVVAAECVEWRGSGHERICVRTSASGGGASYFYVPVLGQWNFYLAKEFSAFAELGISTYFWTPRASSHVGFGAVPHVGMGGRWQFSDVMSLTFRVAYPYTTVGLSFRF